MPALEQEHGVPGHHSHVDDGLRHTTHRSAARVARSASAGASLAEPCPTGSLALARSIEQHTASQARGVVALRSPSSTVALGGIHPAPKAERPGARVCAVTRRPPLATLRTHTHPRTPRAPTTYLGHRTRELESCACDALLRLSGWIHDELLSVRWWLLGERELKSTRRTNLAGTPRIRRNGPGLGAAGSSIWGLAVTEACTMLDANKHSYE